MSVFDISVEVFFKANSKRSSVVLNLTRDLFSFIKVFIGDYELNTLAVNNLGFSE